MREIFNYRYYVLVSLFTIGVVLVFSDVCHTDSFVSWLFRVVLDKLVGIVMCIAGFKLFKRWDDRNEIPFLTKLSSYDD